MPTNHARNKPATTVCTSSHPPKNWPPNLTYLTSPIYSPHVPTTTLNQLRVPVPHPPTPHPDNRPALRLPPEPNTLVAILPITHPSHPANGQHGLTATKTLPPNTFILCYLGRVHSNSPEDTDPASDYDLSLDRELGIGVDARFAGNEGRFINDYRGVPCPPSYPLGQPSAKRDRDGEKQTMKGPNAEFRDVWIDVGGDVVEKRIGVFVLTAGNSGKRGAGIAKGEEVLVSYGKGFWNGRNGNLVEKRIPDLATAVGVT